MLDPFKRARMAATKKIRRATVSAMTDTWGSLLAQSKPVKRKRVKKVKPAVGAEKLRTAAQKSADKSSVSRPVAKVKGSLTSRSKATVPRGAVFTSGIFKNSSDACSYKLYAPVAAKISTEPLPLIVMLHGCRQAPEDFARGTGMNTLAEEFSFLVLYPAQSRKENLSRCWNWFKRDEQMRGSGEPALIADLTRQIMAERDVDPAKVYVAGLSAGASEALIVATAYPDIFAAVGVHSGLAVGAAHDAGSATRAMQSGSPGNRHDTMMPTIIFHGDADKVVNPRNGRFVAIRALEPYSHLDRTEKAGQVPEGRTFTRTIHRVGRGRPYTEQWLIHGSGHAWSGGHAAGSYTDPTGPDASREMVRFFFRHRTTKKRRSNPLA